MRHFRPVNYQTALYYQGKQACLLTSEGKWLNGRVIEVRQDGILFHSSNPGLLFLPFAAIALLALAIGVGYVIGRRPYYAYPGSAGFRAYDPRKPYYN